ncbi:MAG: hypothetical protein Q4F05_18235 [bacterium]|nr:hypothetical protein [bacterium]
MTQLLVLKERIRTFYQKYEMYIEPIMKFLIAFIVFKLINSHLGYDERFSKLIVILGLSVISAFTPSTILVLLAAIYTVIHVYAISPFLAIIAVIVLLIIYVLFARVSPKCGYVILAVPILYLLNLQYTVPILMGLIATPITIVPVCSGVIVYYLFLDIQNAALTSNATANVDDILVLYKQVINGLLGNKTMLLTLCVFAIVLVITYLIRNLAIDHAFEISIISGGACTILLYLIGDFVLDSSGLILKMIIGTILSSIIVYIIQFFRLTLEYSRVEHVQFEDDHYYYYVKAVPKVKVTTPEKSVKRFSTNVETEDDVYEEQPEQFDDGKMSKNQQRMLSEDIQYDFSNLDDIHFDDKE